MAKLEIHCTDYSSINEFYRIGIRYERIADNEDYILWGMVNAGHVKGFEVWRKINRKNPDGTIILKAPSDENFGVTAWYLAGDTDFSWKRIKEIGGFNRFSRSENGWITA